MADTGERRHLNVLIIFVISRVDQEACQCNAV